jgi:hypothetical protein
MKPAACQALLNIQRCVNTGRYRVLPHFRQRLGERGLFWADAQAVLDRPATVQYGGCDWWGRDNWLVAGRVAGGLCLEIVCVVDVDEFGDVVVLITIYEKGR